MQFLISHKRKRLSTQIRTLSIPFPSLYAFLKVVLYGREEDVGPDSSDHQQRIKKQSGQTTHREINKKR